MPTKRLGFGQNSTFLSKNGLKVKCWSESKIVGQKLKFWSKIQIMVKNKNFGEK